MMTSTKGPWWSKGTYSLIKVISSPCNWITYNLADGLEKAFVKKKLMLIPEDTELPPDYAQNGEISPVYKINFRQQKNSSRTNFYTIKSLSDEKCQLRLFTTLKQSKR